MIKCTNCQYYIEADKDGYPFCCLYCMTLDNVAIYDLCKLFVKVDNALYQTLAFCMLSLFGISAVDNLTAPKIEINKTETTQKDTKTEIDVAQIVGKVKKKK